MRRIVLAIAATLAILVAGSLAPNRAEAMTVTPPAGLQAALDGSNLVQDVACRRVWRCGPYGCGWRRVCWGAPYYYGGGSYGYGGGPYYGYGGGPYFGYGRPYYRRYWW